MTEPEDQPLLHDFRAGCPEVCAELVRRHYRAVYRLLVHLSGDVHLAEDLTQETFATAWEKVAAFHGRASLGTWLHRIAYTKFIDAQRAERRAARMRERLAQASTDPPGAFDAVTADDEAQRLYQALHTLDAAERTVLVLHYLQGLTYGEMAAVLGIPIGTVKWRTAEALNRLRALLPEVPDHACGRTSRSIS